jgi:hypothetical protein
VALTRAKDELIVTRQGYRLWAKDLSQQKSDDGTDSALYFFDALPENIFDEHIHKREGWVTTTNAPQTQPSTVGITIGEESAATIFPDFGLPLSFKIETLSDAACYGSIKATKFFLENGANPNVPKDSRRNEKWTPLHFAAWNVKGGTIHNGELDHHQEIAELLIKHGANIDQKNNEGQTPLMWAATKGVPQMVLILINAGANVHATDCRGKSVLEYAQQTTTCGAQIEETVQIIKKTMTLSERT